MYGIVKILGLSSEFCETDGDDFFCKLDFSAATLSRDDTQAS